MKYNQPFILRFTNEPMRMRHFTLIPNESYIIGSHSDSDIRIDGDPTVSRRHASLTLRTDGRVVIADLKSTNGTFINNKRVKESGRMKTGDALRLGSGTLCVLQPWSALESSLPPGVTSGVELIPPAESLQQKHFMKTAPLWFTVAGFCIGGICFSIWQVFEYQQKGFARTVPPAVFPAGKSSDISPDGLPDALSPLHADSRSGSAPDTDVPLVASDFVWDEIVNISQRFGEIPPSAMDPQFVTQVEHWINFYTKNNRHVDLMRRRDAVWSRIQKILQTHGLPAELGYIAWVESAFDTHAVSHAGAVGMWQFIDSTGQEYGLVDSSKDSRRQIDASTHAAARYLNALLNQFGNRRYLLAIAAYNAGQNRIRRQEISESIRISKKADFWHLKETLPKETLDYVPKVLAAIIIGRNPENW